MEIYKRRRVVLLTWTAISRRRKSPVCRSAVSQRQMWPVCRPVPDLTRKWRGVVKGRSEQVLECNVHLRVMSQTWTCTPLQMWQRRGLGRKFTFVRSLFSWIKTWMTNPYSCLFFFFPTSPSLLFTNEAVQAPVSPARRKHGHWNWDDRWRIQEFRGSNLKADE